MNKFVKSVGVGMLGLVLLVGCAEQQTKRDANNCAGKTDAKKAKSSCSANKCSTK